MVAFTLARDVVTGGLGNELIKVVDFWYNVSPERMIITNN
jgi:hypothetical protein